MACHIQSCRFYLQKLKYMTIYLNVRNVKIYLFLYSRWVCWSINVLESITFKRSMIKCVMDLFSTPLSISWQQKTMKALHPCSFVMQLHQWLVDNQWLVDFPYKGHVKSASMSYCHNVCWKVLPSNNRNECVMNTPPHLYGYLISGVPMRWRGMKGFAFMVCFNVKPGIFWIEQLGSMVTGINQNKRWTDQLDGREYQMTHKHN